MNTLEEALKNSDLTYENLGNIAKGIVDTYTADIDKLLKESTSVNEMNNDQIRMLFTKLSFKAYSLGEAKEYAALKSDCAAALTKELQATEFNLSQEKTAEARRNVATLNSKNEALVEMLYKTVAALLKTKLDETHRIVDTLKTVVLSRNSEDKLKSTINDLGVIA